MMKKKILNTHLAMIRNIILDGGWKAKNLLICSSHICFSLSFASNESRGKEEKDKTFPADYILRLCESTQINSEGENPSRP
jgi:hypothetical protein